MQLGVPAMDLQDSNVYITPGMQVMLLVICVRDVWARARACGSGNNRWA